MLLVVERTEVQIFFLFLGWGLSVAVGAAGSGNGNWKEGKTIAPTTAASPALEMGHCTGSACPHSPCTQQQCPACS